MRPLVLVGAVAALLGGLAWTLRGLWVVATGTEPPLLIGVGPVFFLVALVGLIALVPTSSLRVRIGIGLTTAGALFYVAAVVVHFQASGAGEGALRLVSLLAMILALIVVGRAVKGHDALPGRWRTLPMWLGMLIIPAIVVFGIMATALGGAAARRLLEVPIVLFGLGWLGLGIQMLRVAARPLDHSGSKSSAAELMQ